MTSTDSKTSNCRVCVYTYIILLLHNISNIILNILYLIFHIYIMISLKSVWSQKGGIAKIYILSFHSSSSIFLIINILISGFMHSLRERQLLSRWSNILEFGSNCSSHLICTDRFQVSSLSMSRRFYIQPPKQLKKSMLSTSQKGGGQILTFSPIIVSY